MQVFDFDKIMWAIAIGIGSLLLASNIGNILYIPETELVARGYKIKIKEAVKVDDKPEGLPEELDMSAILSKAVAEKGEQVFRQCAACHTPNKGGPNRIGPNLWNIIGRSAASHAGFSYSSAMKKRDDKKWDYEELYRYLYSPRSYVPGTKMAFAGIKDNEARANLIAYLRTLSDNPKPLP